ncbi:uncharacterized protein JN550_007573 [Neoarthrinium moseri]|uniref:uncharacterized protein n=1 Tax=Neoarthrinium moseri TaxID=1658444 RepID=UPI001FDDBC20|nr:uncharacterized protein JN550_007573 [Neoarthrinium moseri]KAI1866720.1 hypothetical protein JN550_007573 [Neoarthrinium moseri]
MTRHLFPTRPGEGSHMFPDPTRNMLTVLVGEFCGTFMFLLLSFIGTQTAIVTNNPNDYTAPLAPFSLLYVAFSFGAAVAVNVWIFYRVTGGMFNPAITLGLVLVGAVGPLRGLFVFITQLVAAIAAAAVADGLTPGPALFGDKLGGGANTAQGFFLEFFLTAQLVLTVFFLAVEKHRATYLAPIGIGISVFIAHICATNWTGTSINPARAFGPAVITNFPGYHWIYWIGPLTGSLLAYGCYALLRWMKYNTANPGQDEDDLERFYSHSDRGLNEKNSNTTSNPASNAASQKKGHSRMDSGYSGVIHHDEGSGSPSGGPVAPSTVLPTSEPVSDTHNTHMPHINLPNDR